MNYKDLNRFIKMPREEPMKRNRFYLTMPKQFGKVEYWLKKPDLKDEENLELTLVDIIGRREDDRMMEFIRLHMHGDPEFSELNNGFDYKITGVDPTGVTILEYNYFGVAESFNFGVLDNENLDITIKFRNIKK